MFGAKRLSADFFVRAVRIRQFFPQAANQKKNFFEMSENLILGSTIRLKIC